MRLVRLGFYCVLKQFTRNESAKNVCKCKSKQCKIKVKYTSSDQALRSASKNFYYWIVPTCGIYVEQLINAICDMLVEQWTN